MVKFTADRLCWLNLRGMWQQQSPEMEMFLQVSLGGVSDLIWLCCDLTVETAT